MHDFPDNLDIDFEIGVNDPVAQSDNLPPGNPGMRLLGGFAYTGSGFANEVVSHSVV